MNKYVVKANLFFYFMTTSYYIKSRNNYINGDPDEIEKKRNSIDKTVKITRFHAFIRYQFLTFISFGCFRDSSLVGFHHVFVCVLRMRRFPYFNAPFFTRIFLHRYIAVRVLICQNFLSILQSIHALHWRSFSAWHSSLYSTRASSIRSSHNTFGERFVFIDLLYKLLHNHWYSL